MLFFVMGQTLELTAFLPLELVWTRLLSKSAWIEAPLSF
ncbi:hypothetical protein CKA32_003416 [Geitlerinema sp. FC II]|nr:hypothetical protein CKA32_003416 [Geitlerinema sp. FC II]